MIKASGDGLQPSPQYMSKVSRKAMRQNDNARVFRAWRAVTEALIAKRLTVSTMESCTGGLIASLITDTEGASDVLRGAFVTYCNEAKVMQGVPAQTIKTCGVYSPETAAAMARACRAAYGADLGIGVTGTLGRLDPDNRDSVRGQVFFALCDAQDAAAHALVLPPLPDRRACKLYVAERIAEALLEKIGP